METDHNTSGTQHSIGLQATVWRQTTTRQGLNTLSVYRPLYGDRPQHVRDSTLYRSTGHCMETDHNTSGTQHSIGLQATVWRQITSRQGLNTLSVYHNTSGTQHSIGLQVTVETDHNTSG